MSGVLGIGLDLVEVERVAAILDRHGERFIERICRPGEPRTTAGSGRAEHVAGLFAAKEAVLKALGSGWARGLGFRQVEIVHDDDGRPGVVLHGAAEDRARSMSVGAIHLSITHERRTAAAVAVLSGYR